MGPVQQIKNNQALAKRNLITGPGQQSVYFDDCQFLPGRVENISQFLWLTLEFCSDGRNAAWPGPRAACEVFLSCVSHQSYQPLRPRRSEATDHPRNRCLHPDSWALKYNGAAKSTQNWIMRGLRRYIAVARGPDRTSWSWCQGVSVKSNLLLTVISISLEDTSEY